MANASPQWEEARRGYNQVAVKESPVFLGAHAWARWQPQPVTIEPADWQSADRHLAFVWWAIQHALAQATPARTLHDGVSLLPVGDGLFAELRAHPYGPGDAPIRASLTASATLKAVAGTSRWVLAPLTGRVDTHVSQSDVRTATGYALPTGLTVVGKGWGLTIRFLASPLFFG